jgi:hypothetical protein
MAEDELEALLPRTHCPPSCDGFGTYAEADEDGDATPAQCQWCYEVVMPLRDKIRAYTTNKIIEAKNEGFIAKLQEYPIVEQQIILGGLIYKYLMAETNADHVDIKLENFSQDGKVLGDLQITVALNHRKDK